MPGDHPPGNPWGETRASRTLLAIDWHTLVDKGLGQPLPEDPADRELEERARQEKAAALEQLFRSRLSVLIGPAGTGKTTLLKALCSLPDIAARGLLLLAPTGKARVRLEEQTGLRGSGQTLAQYLNRMRRYDGKTGAYFPKRAVPRCGDYRTVIVDECSMLTEEQLAALFDSLANVERLVLVGDPRQLPPIGAGRPFVDIVKWLEPANVEFLFPRSGAGYAELTIPRRQKGGRRAQTCSCHLTSVRGPSIQARTVCSMVPGESTTNSYDSCSGTTRRNYKRKLWLNSSGRWTSVGRTTR